MKAIDVLARLQRMRPSDNGWIARCPAHSDRKRLLSVNGDQNGEVTLHCSAGCPPEAIIAALQGLPWPRAFGLPTNALEAVEATRKRRSTALSRLKFDYSNASGASCDERQR